MADDEPRKMSITNLRNGKTMEAQFNPTEIGAKVAAAYEDLAILGLSHRPQQFKYVDNIEIEPELFFDRLTNSGGGREDRTRGAGASARRRRRPR